MKLRLRVIGRVQGVGFRYTTTMLARDLSITGTVRNEDDGSVTIEAIGTEKQLTDFIKKLRHPQNPFAKVREIQQTEDPSIPEKSNFDVLY